MKEKAEMTDKDLEWEEISTEHVVQDQWIDFRRSAYRYPDGRVFSPFYSYSRRDFAVIVASDEEGRYICVRQFRQGIKTVTTEFPAGGIEPGKSQESALEAAKRELKEETGYVSDRWRKLLSIPSSATISDNTAWLFVAENCRRTAAQELDAMELLRVEKHTAEEIDVMLAEGSFQQSVHALAWLLSKQAP